MKKLFLAFISFLFLGGLATGALKVWNYTVDTEKEFKQNVYVAFGHGEITGRADEVKQIEELSEYQSEFDIYNASYYYEQLNATEQSVYRCFQYALDNSYRSILIPEQVVKEMNYKPTDVLYFLSMDSPVVEQNITSAEDGFDMTVTKYCLWKEMNRSISGTYMYTDLFTEEKLEKKQEAVLAAKELLGQMPESVQGIERARYWYNYLTENVSYYSYEEQDERNYLYDGIIGNKTQCDGFANAYSLLANMSGIRCAEKVSLPDGKEGHTWNMFCVDGQWYNLDASAGSDLDKDMKEFKYLRFGYADNLQTNDVHYPELVPTCDENTFEVDGSYQNSAEFTARSLGEIWKRTGKDALIVRTEFVPADRVFQSLANYMRCDVGYTSISGAKVNIYIIRKH